MKILMMTGRIIVVIKKPDVVIITSNLEVISLNYLNDIKLINKIVEKILGSKYKDIHVNSYKPFLPP